MPKKEKRQWISVNRADSSYAKVYCGYFEEPEPDIPNYKHASLTLHDGENTTCIHFDKAKKVGGLIKLLQELHGWMEK